MVKRIEQSSAQSSTRLPGQAGIEADDYAENMLKDGHNRAEKDRIVREAPDYERAAKTGKRETSPTPDGWQATDAQVAPEELAHPALPMPTGSLSSRDGTEASGAYDETGGPMGGQEEELDEMQGATRPVDRHARMRK